MHQRSPAEHSEAVDFDRFQALTFDCYGTLVDWERGILDALLPLFRRHGVDAVGEEQVLQRFAVHESAVEREAYRSYRQVLGQVLHRLGGDFGFVPSTAEEAGFAASVGSWPVFPDTVPSLRALAGRYRLAIVSNVDDDLFEESARRLEVSFETVVTASRVRAYKPARAHFDEALARLGLPKEAVLHVAQSLYHDIAPARALGFTCVWVNRRAGRPGGGATAPAEAVPDLEVPDLRTLVARAVPAV